MQNRHHVFSTHCVVGLRVLIILHASSLIAQHLFLLIDISVPVPIE